MTTNTQTNSHSVLSNVYVLPLLGAGEAAFGPQGNFIQCQLTQENLILVRVLDRMSVAIQLLADHPAYFLDYLDPEDGTTVLLYHAKVWLSDLLKFREGKYSHFSAEAKKRIKQFAGAWDVYGKFVKLPEDKLVLHALDKTDRARQYWERELDIRLPPDAECLSLPSDDCYSQP